MSAAHLGADNWQRPSPLFQRTTDRGFGAAVRRRSVPNREAVFQAPQEGIDGLMGVASGPNAAEPGCAQCESFPAEAPLKKRRASCLHLCARKTGGRTGGLHAGGSLARPSGVSTANQPSQTSGRFGCFLYSPSVQGRRAPEGRTMLPSHSRKRCHPSRRTAQAPAK